MTEEFDPQVVAQQVYDNYPPSRIQLLKLMRRHTIQVIVWEYMLKNNVGMTVDTTDAKELSKDSTHVVDVTNKLWDLLHK